MEVMRAALMRLRCVRLARGLSEWQGACFDRACRAEQLAACGEEVVLRLGGMLLLKGWRLWRLVVLAERHAVRAFRRWRLGCERKSDAALREQRLMERSVGHMRFRAACEQEWHEGEDCPATRRRQGTQEPPLGWAVASHGLGCLGFLAPVSLLLVS